MKRFILWVMLPAMFLASCQTVTQTVTQTKTPASLPTITNQAAEVNTAEQQTIQPTANPTIEPAQTATGVATATAILSPELEAYLDEAIGIIQANSLFAEQVDWPAVRGMAIQDAAGAQTTADLFPTLEFLINATGDRHGYIMPARELEEYYSPLTPDLIPAIPAEILQDQIAYFAVPGFMSGNLDSVTEFARLLQSTIQELDSTNPCGWIIDLRNNEGGNGMAMLLGVSPLLKPGVAGWYTYTDGSTQEWRLTENQVSLGDVRLTELEMPRYQVQQPDPPIAVLTNEATASAGELVTVAFRGWPNIRSFGWRTLGRTTAPQGFALSDGTMLSISVAYFSDHTGQIYTDRIRPDVPISSREHPMLRSNGVPQEAIDWLLNQSACQTP